MAGEFKVPEEVRTDEQWHLMRRDSYPFRHQVGQKYIQI
jgi:hypothetical protein